MSIFSVLSLQIFIFSIKFVYNVDTHPVLMISFNSVQSDVFNNYVKEHPDSNFAKLISNGVEAEYMEPSFPTLSFPNLFSLVTGLYPESHGVVSDVMYDPYYDTSVDLSLHNDESLDEKWWNQSEPIWMTAKQKGLKTASFFWHGSEVIGRTPDVWAAYKENYPVKLRIDNVVNWITKLKMDFTILYIDELTSIGQLYGPESQKYKDALKEIDVLLGYLLSKLKEHNVLDTTDILVVSDQGMVTMKKNSTVILNAYVDETLIDMEKSVLGVVSHIYPKDGKVEDVYKALKFDAIHINTYYPHEIPRPLHYSQSHRIPPIVALAAEGYILSDKQETYLGNNGFLNTIEPMRTIFLAHGPSFKTNAKLPSLKNVDVYSLLCHLLSVTPLPNNGTINSFINGLKNPPQTTATTTTPTTPTKPQTTQTTMTTATTATTATTTTTATTATTVTTTTTATTSTTVTTTTTTTTPSDEKNGNSASNMSMKFTILAPIALKYIAHVIFNQ